ncbi:MAG: SDR family oxidoreductase [Candidatus Binatus sp.]|uniref:SDR family oxidoreductase n=1 Tax=Candidatus Binatus sp. TaxID=2811406 RepID=UPI00271D57E4|nr:SDR family oxidoreductase [Candidatus Binatus sp.]MDO8431114.1 SDR family oxidoreductase [Candidatus Binatus sp.]
MSETPASPPSEKPVALVTGAGRGIGRAIALELAASGFSLCLVARSREQLEETRSLTDLPHERSLIVLIDLAGGDAPDAVIHTVLDCYGRLDLLVNNAGWAPPRASITRMRAEDLDRIIAVNLRAPIALARLAALQMTKQGNGAIINICSSAGHKTPAGEAVYAASKAGLIAFTRASFQDLRASGIKLAAISPGLVDTCLIPPNKRLDRATMLAPGDVAHAVMQIVNSPMRACPVEIALEPQFDPERSR